MKLRIISAFVATIFTFSATLSGLYDDCCEQECSDQAIGSCCNDWLKRTEWSFDLNDHAKPNWEVETIQPFYTTPCNYGHTLFWQGRVSKRSSDNTYNIGLGWRYLTCNQDWLFGVNSFFDSTRKHKHQRLGAGLETMYRQFTFRANYYRPTTGKRCVKRDDGIRWTEEALEGYDWELESPLPYLPWARLAFSGYHFRGDERGDINGYRGNLWMFISDNIQLEAGRSADNRHHNNFIKFIFTFGRPCEVEYTLLKDFCSRDAFVCRNLANWTLAKVKRENDIVIERVTLNSGAQGQIEIGRGN